MRYSILNKHSTIAIPSTGIFTPLRTLCSASRITTMVASVFTRIIATFPAGISAIITCVLLTCAFTSRFATLSAIFITILSAIHLTASSATTTTPAIASISTPIGTAVFTSSRTAILTQTCTTYKTISCFSTFMSM